MGCDIHVALECRQSDGTWKLNKHLELEVDSENEHNEWISLNWESLSEHSTGYDRDIEGRDYYLFGALTGGEVRWDITDGFTRDETACDDFSDSCDEIVRLIKCWDVDAHSHGSIILHNYKEKLATMLLSLGQGNDTYGSLLNWYNAILPYFEGYEPEDCRVIFFFDN